MSNFVDNSSARARAVTARTYCRPLDDNGDTFELWSDVIHRAHYEHQKRLTEEAGGKVNLEELKELEQLGLEHKSLLAGRTLFLGGTKYAYERPCCQFNCSYVEASSIYSIVDIAWLLLNGAGVGFKPVVGTLHGFIKPINDVTVIPSENSASFKGPENNEEIKASSENDFTWRIKIGDSASAWAKAIGKLVNPRISKVNKLILDFSNVRGPGGRLKTYSWLCNGSEPLTAAMKAIISISNNKAGELLDEIDILDIVNWLGTILSSRRAAEIAMLDSSNPRWKEFINAKKEYWINNPQRRQSNNTLLFWSKPSKDKIKELLYSADASGGDPGIENAEAAKHKCPWMAGGNPCGSKDLRLITKNGLLQLGDLAELGHSFEAWDGTSWVETTAFKTGTKPLLKLTFSNGQTIRVTEDHKIKLNNDLVSSAKDMLGKKVKQVCEEEAPKFKFNDFDSKMVMRGFVCGDGGYKKTINRWLYVYIGKKDKDVLNYFREHGVHLKQEYKHTKRTDKFIISKKDSEIFEGWITPKILPSGIITKKVLDSTPNEIRSFLRGLYSANSTVLDKHKRISLTSSCRELITSVQKMLTLFGIRTYITTKKSKNITFRNGKYLCKESYDLCMTGKSLIKFNDNIGFIHKYKTKKLQKAILNITKTNPRPVKVIKIEQDNIEDVYDFTMKSTHWASAEGFCISNCNEIILPNHGFCNLVTNCIPNFKRNFNALERAVYIIAKANYKQSCVNLNDQILQPVWDQTNSALHLCGVSLTGIVQCDWLTDYQIRRLKNAAICGAYNIADELGLPRPKAVCTLKPEGTLTKCCGNTELEEITEGLHRPLGKYIFNWINFSKHDPLVELLESAGYKTLQNPSDSNNILVCFPVTYKNVEFDVVDGKHVNLESAVSQLNRYLRWTNLWSDFNSSCTVSYSPEEIPEITDWIYDNWDRGYIATSFLRRNDPTKTAQDLGHPYLPQEVTTEDKYMEYSSQLREVNWNKLHGIYDIDSQECAGGTCPVR